jgi:hypothetical protein
LRFSCAFAADRQWLDRHFLPPFFVSRRVYVLVASLARVAGRQLKMKESQCPRFTMAVKGIDVVLVLAPPIAQVAPGMYRFHAEIERVSGHLFRDGHYKQNFDRGVDQRRACSRPSGRVDSAVFSATFH